MNGVPRILRIVEAPIDGFEALSPLELSEPQVVEEQVVVVLVQVEARLEKECNQLSSREFILIRFTETMLTILNVAFVGHSIIECMFPCSRYWYCLAAWWARWSRAEETSRARLSPSLMVARI